MNQQIVNIYWLAETAYYEDTVIVPHRHPDYYQIYYILDGRGRFLLDGNYHSFVGGMFFLVHPGEVHGIDRLKPVSGSVELLEMKFGVFDAKLVETLSAVNGPCYGTDELLQDFRRIFDEALRKDFYYEERLPHLFAAWLYRVAYTFKNAMRPKDEGRENAPAARIKKYIDEHYRENVTLEKLAEVEPFSKNYLCHLFRKGTGMTINDYVNQVRISKAKELLNNSKMDVEEIGLECGFSSVHYFINVFKKIVGIPPGVYRRSEINGRQYLKGPASVVITGMDRPVT